MAHANFIGGDWQQARSGATDAVVNPATGASLGDVPSSDAADVDAAVTAASAAFESWSRTTPRERSEILGKVAQVIEDNVEELSRIECENVGKPVGIIEFEMDLTLDNWRFFAAAPRFMEGKAAGEYMEGYTSMIRRDPIGVIGSIAPWNYPVQLALCPLVGALAAVLSLHGVPIDRPSFRRALVRLALAAHHAAQGGLGSGIDVVAATHGGLLAYRRGDPRWLERMEGRGLSALEIARGGWPGLRAEALSVPRHMRLLCGYTGRSSATTGLVRRYRAWAQRQPEAHARFLAASRRAAAALAKALRAGVHRHILAALDAAQEPIDELMRWSGLPIVTRRLRELIHLAREAGGGAKVSGAGGGDCGIALAFDRASAERITRAWQAADIVPIPLAIDPHGVEETMLERRGDRTA